MPILEYKKSILHYKKAGYGPKILLAFHGFGQDHHAFDILTEEIKEHYTVYAFDLYFHGKSEWRYGEQPLEKAVLTEIISAFLNNNSIKTFSLAGFSLGCRFVLALLEKFSDNVDKIFLLAPDGIRTSFWFTLSTYPLLLRKFFKSTVHHPARFKVIVNTLYKIRLMDKGLLKFVEHQMSTTEKRRRVYYSWVVFRHLKFNAKSLITLINVNKVPVTIVVGVHDRVITASSIKQFTKHLHKVDFNLLQSGHTVLLRDQNLPKLFKA